jgi:uncharacterized protein (DUF58 family)
MAASTHTPAIRSAGSWPAQWRQRIWRTAPDDVAPVTLHHSRIYILPTRRGLAFGCTLAAMLLTSLNYSLSLGFAITFLMIGLGASALLHTFRNVAGIAVRPLAAGETFAGGTLPFVISMMGGAGIRRAFVLVAGENRTHRFDLPAGRALPVTIHRSAPTRGRLALGRVTVTSDYPVGLWRAWAYVHFAVEGLVFPAPEASPPPLPPGVEGVHALPGARGEDTDLAGLRSYQRGDPAQRIAWKSVARGGEWHTKQFEGAGGGGPVTLAWDELPADMPREARIARLTAWVLAAERAARPFALRLPGAHVPVGQGRDHRRAALTALALVPKERGA